VRRIVATVSLVLAACSSSGPAQRTIELKTIAFRPAGISVGAGSTVTWRNEDDFAHTVTAGTPDTPERARFDERLATGETFDVMFPEPGTFPFFCRIHPANMQGEVTVR
jgi:plastocyanin